MTNDDLFDKRFVNREKLGQMPNKSFRTRNGLSCIKNLLKNWPNRSQAVAVRSLVTAADNISTVQDSSSACFARYGCYRI